jgi:hypothetical protein
MYTIFAPLDANEPLTRELLMAGRRHRTVGRWELAGALWLPALAAILTLVGLSGLPPLVAIGLIALTLAGLIAYAVDGGRRSGLK